MVGIYHIGLVAEVSCMPTRSSESQVLNRVFSSAEGMGSMWGFMARAESFPSSVRCPAWLGAMA